MRGQQRMPFQNEEHLGLETSTIQYFNRKVTQVQPGPPGIGPKVHPGQFQMFMTPREIRSKYQVLDADREDVEDWRGGEPTGRSHTTAGATNEPITTARREQLARWHGGASQVAGYTHQRGYASEMEDDDQMLSRKLDESQMDPGEYAEVHGGVAPEPPGYDTLGQRSSAPSYLRDGSQRSGEGSGTYWARQEEAQGYVDRKQGEWSDTHSASLYDRIREEGVQKPIHLSVEQMGSLGKPQIVGGHHRLAAQQDINPDQPMAVQHWRNILHAKLSGEYS